MRKFCIFFSLFLSIPCSASYEYRRSLKIGADDEFLDVCISHHSTTIDQIIKQTKKQARLAHLLASKIPITDTKDSFISSLESHVSIDGFLEYNICNCPVKKSCILKNKTRSYWLSHLTARIQEHSSQKKHKQQPHNLSIKPLQEALATLALIAEFEQPSRPEQGNTKNEEFIFTSENEDYAYLLENACNYIRKNQRMLSRLILWHKYSLQTAWKSTDCIAVWLTMAAAKPEDFNNKDLFEITKNYLDGLKLYTHLAPTKISDAAPFSFSRAVYRFNSDKAHLMSYEKEPSLKNILQLAQIVADHVRVGLYCAERIAWDSMDPSPISTMRDILGATEYEIVGDVDKGKTLAYLCMASYSVLNQLEKREKDVPKLLHWTGFASYILYAFLEDLEILSVRPVFPANYFFNKTDWPSFLKYNIILSLAHTSTEGLARLLPFVKERQSPQQEAEQLRLYKAMLRGAAFHYTGATTSKIISLMKAHPPFTLVLLEEPKY
jgi:hypothetical protein